MGYDARREIITIDYEYRVPAHHTRPHLIPPAPLSKLTNTPLPSMHRSAICHPLVPSLRGKNPNRMRGHKENQLVDQHRSVSTSICPPNTRTTEKIVKRAKPRTTTSSRCPATVHQSRHEPWPQSHLCTGMHLHHALFIGAPEVLRAVVAMR